MTHTDETNTNIVVTHIIKKVDLNSAHSMNKVN